MVVSRLLCGIENWMKDKRTGEIQTVQMQFLRIVRRRAKFDKTKSDNIRYKVSVW
jgi:hypothetical protein